jgi:hypothetical protein
LATAFLAVGLRAGYLAALAFLAGDLAGARFAAVLIYHCRSAEEARALWSALGDRLAACKLVLHPVKTKVVSHLLARSAPRIGFVDPFPFKCAAAAAPPDRTRHVKGAAEDKSCR